MCVQISVCSHSLYVVQCTRLQSRVGLLFDDYNETFETNNSRDLMSIFQI